MKDCKSGCGYTGACKVYISAVQLLCILAGNIYYFELRTYRVSFAIHCL